MYFLCPNLYGRNMKEKNNTNEQINLKNYHNSQGLLFIGKPFFLIYNFLQNSLFPKATQLFILKGLPFGSPFLFY